MPPATAPPATPHRTWTATYPGDLTCLPAIRASLRHRLRDAATTDDAVLCASELAANAMRHSTSRLPGGTVTIRATRHRNDHALIEVTDDGGAWTRADSPDRRHGLDLIHALAADWDIDGDFRGRTVWARIPWHPTPPRNPRADYDLSLAAALHHARYSRGVQWSMTIDGPCLRELRQLHGLSQEALVDQAGVRLATLARLEREPDARCRPRTLVRLADTLGEHPAVSRYPRDIRGMANGHDASCRPFIQPRRG